jgi:hypothetical protein
LSGDTSDITTSLFTSNRCSNSDGGFGARRFSVSDQTTSINVGWSSTNVTSNIGQIVIGLTSSAPTTPMTPQLAPTITSGPYPAGVALQWSTSGTGVVDWIGDTYPTQSLVVRTKFYIDDVYHSKHDGAGNTSNNIDSVTLVSLPPSTLQQVKFSLETSAGGESALSPALAVQTTAPSTPFDGGTNDMSLSQVLHHLPGEITFSFVTPLPLWDDPLATPSETYVITRTDSAVPPVVSTTTVVVPLGTSAGTVVFATIRGLIGGSTNTFSVAASDDCCGGAGPTSASQAFTQPAAEAPEPMTIHPVPISTNDSHVRLQISVPPDGGKPIQT